MILHSRSKAANQYFLREIGVNWYLQFNHDMTQVPEGATKVPFIRVPTDDPNVCVASPQSIKCPWRSRRAENIESLANEEIAAMGFLTGEELRQIAQDSPGSYWYIWGEPNKFGYLTGSRFAPVFHFISTHIKEGDPTAKIISPSILNWDFTCIDCGDINIKQPCEGVDLQGYQCGKLWLKEFISAYEGRYNGKPPVDAWAIDVYPIDWTNTPNNDPQQPARYEAKGVSALHSFIATQQLVGMREYLDTIGYADTPIWITEIAIHLGFDHWKYDPFPILVPDDDDGDDPADFHWDKMGDYLVAILDWLEDNADSHKIERSFFFATWKDIWNGVPGGYLGIIYFDGPGQGAARTCLGDLLRARSLGEPRVKCDALGNTIADPTTPQ